MTPRLWWALGAISMAACQPATIDHPMAFFTMQPRFVCQGDEHGTSVMLDATQSSARPRLLLAGESADTEPVDLVWSFDSEDVRLVSGAFDNAIVEVSFAGERPVQVSLRVERADGAATTLSDVVGLTQPTAEPCPDAGEPCGPGARCVGDEGTARCLPEVRCAEDSDCPACYRCSADGGLCEP